MVMELSKKIVPNTNDKDMENRWRYFTQILHRPNLLDEGEVAGIKDIFDVFRILMSRGKIRYGEYGVLKEILSRLKLHSCVDIIKKCEGEIRTAAQFHTQDDGMGLSESQMLDMSIEENGNSDENSCDKTSEENKAMRKRKRPNNQECLECKLKIKAIRMQTEVEAAELDKTTMVTYKNILKTYNKALENAESNQTVQDANKSLEKAMEMIQKLHQYRIGLIKMSLGSLNLLFIFGSRNAAETFWDLYTSGLLLNILQEGLVTPSVLEECNVLSVELEISVDIHHYEEHLRRMQVDVNEKPWTTQKETGKRTPHLFQEEGEINQETNETAEVDIPENQPFKDIGNTSDILLIPEEDNPELESDSKDSWAEAHLFQVEGEINQETLKKLVADVDISGNVSDDLFISKEDNNELESDSLESWTEKEIDSKDKRITLNKSAHKVPLDAKVVLRQKLQRNLFETLKDTKRPANIAVIGPPGVGKSSFLNTLIASITGNYKSFFKVGKNAVHMMTKVGPNVYLPGIKDSNLYPTFIGISGIQLDADKVDEELLKIIVYGRMPDKTPLKSIRSYGLQYGVKFLQEVYAKQVGVEVDRIFFVSSAVEQIPTKLIKCVLNAALPKIGSSTHTKAITIFGILTKSDLIKPNTSIKRKMDLFSKELGLTGAAERRALMTNYTDKCLAALKYIEKKQIPELDIPALLLLKEACMDEYEPDFVAVPTVLEVPKRKYTLKVPRHTPSKRTPFCRRYVYVWLALMVLIAAICVHFFLSID